MTCWNHITKTMHKFYFFIWLRWATRLTIGSTILASVISFIITLFIYFSQGAPALNNESLNALFDVFKFWFPITWSLALLISLFRGLKYIFNTCINGFELKLLECEKIEEQVNKKKERGQEHKRIT